MTDCFSAQVQLWIWIVLECNVTRSHFTQLILLVCAILCGCVHEWLWLNTCTVSLVKFCLCIDRGCYSNMPSSRHRANHQSYATCRYIQASCFYAWASPKPRSLPLVIHLIHYQKTRHHISLYYSNTNMKIQTKHGVYIMKKFICLYFLVCVWHLCLIPLLCLLWMCDIKL